jgi:uncharacterized protein YecT (DUF1311 family)
MRVITAAIVAATLWTITARAEDAQIVVKTSPAFDACTAKAVSTYENEDCAKAENERWDKRLNAAYARIMASPHWNKATKELVREAQRAWIGYRQAKCLAAGELEAEGGTLSRIVASNCFVTETALRAVELEGALAPH